MVLCPFILISLLHMYSFFRVLVIITTSTYIQTCNNLSFYVWVSSLSMIVSCFISWKKIIIFLLLFFLPFFFEAVFCISLTVLELGQFVENNGLILTDIHLPPPLEIKGVDHYHLALIYFWLWFWLCSVNTLYFHYPFFSWWTNAFFSMYGHDELYDILQDIQEQ